MRTAGANDRYGRNMLLPPLPLLPKKYPFSSQKHDSTCNHLQKAKERIEWVYSPDFWGSGKTLCFASHRRGHRFESCNAH